MKKQYDEVILIFPHQLFEHHELLKTDLPLILWEAPHFFTRFGFHKTKLVLHRATMQFYKQHLKKNKHTVLYCSFNESIEKIINAHKIKKIKYIDPVDTIVEKSLNKLCKSLSIKTEKHETPAFMLSDKIVRETFKKAKKSFRLYPFYVQQRKRFSILVHKNKPIGGKWTFDVENRKKIPAHIKIPPAWKPKTTPFVKEAMSYTQNCFAKNPGSINQFCYPVTFNDAHRWFDDFLHKRFAFFGVYQDAINQEQPFLFHSVLSPLLNCGLLTPQFVVEKAVAYGRAHSIALNSIEGFVRQILGWREYVRGIYIMHGEKQKKSNFFKHTHKLPSSWWNATTGIAPIDTTIQKVLTYAYAHHIERLMILGNYMLLHQTNPQDVYKWFMELFIDAYDWVMIPNVFGMSQFADGGLMMTKPYISSSNYIRTMSTTFHKGAWCDQWNAHYWFFLYRNKKKLAHNPRMAIAYQQLKKLDAKKLKQYIQQAQSLSV